MRIVDTLIQEMKQEAATTRKCLERVPEGKLGWQPHPKSLTLGVLATHIAETPGGIAKMVTGDQLDAADIRMPEAAASSAELLRRFDESLASAEKTLDGFDDAALMKSWSLMRNGATVMSMPKVAVLRVIAMNHVYHHRGQLSVYLRLLDVPLPSIYGPSADDNPFA